MQEIGAGRGPSRWTIPTSPAPWPGWWRAAKSDAGIVIDGAGIGSAIAANKVAGVRAAMCTDATLARYAREHNGANVLALGRDAAERADARWRSSTPGWPRR